ncbi:SDR family NAD(P)-dependent oxidoreductase [Roseateles sp.]|uniref:SDR family NAD(P)-dependent oxidoreductase n=1 Tax=Roseateles sp. TaxID=1971397 RepID=UPI002F3FB3A4
MINRYPLEGLHAVVTGGGSGIGAAIAQALIADGARVTLVGRRLEKLKEQRDKLNVDGGLSVELQVCDVGDEASVRQAFAAAVAAAGPVDLLVNNAGQVETAPLAKTSLDTWQRLLNVNLTGSFLCSREVLPAMSERRFGRIVNVASTAALKGYAYVAAYCAAKHGVLGLTRALALETARKGVTVNAVCPGYTETDIVAGAIDTIVAKTGRTADEARAELASVNPQGRLVDPAEVAASVAWLARRDSGSITGQAIAVAGGEVM